MITITTVFPSPSEEALTSCSRRAAPSEAAKKTSSYQWAARPALSALCQDSGAVEPCPLLRLLRKIGRLVRRWEPRMAAWRLSSLTTHPLFRLLPPCLVSWPPSKRLDHLHLAQSTPSVRTPSTCCSTRRGWLPSRRSRGCRSLTG